jgi:hypothetical protein
MLIHSTDYFYFFYYWTIYDAKKDLKILNYSDFVKCREDYIKMSKENKNIHIIENSFACPDKSTIEEIREYFLQNGKLPKMEEETQELHKKYDNQS